MDLNEFEIYKGKSFAALCKDIVVNQNNKKNQLDILITDLRKLIKSTNDAIIIVPLIKDYFDVSVKNDEQLVKLAAVVQKILTRGAGPGESSDSFVLTDDERKELLTEIENLKKESEETLASGVKETPQ